MADVQALTDNAEQPEQGATEVLEVALDYLAVGIDPKVATMVIQSGVPEMAELPSTTSTSSRVARLGRNPTVKDEMHQKGFDADVPGRLPRLPGQPGGGHHGLQGRRGPVGEDQLPMIEQTDGDRAPVQPALRARAGRADRARLEARAPAGNRRPEQDGEIARQRHRPLRSDGRGCTEGDGHVHGSGARPCRAARYGRGQPGVHLPGGVRAGRGGRGGSQAEIPGAAGWEMSW